MEPTLSPRFELSISTEMDLTKTNELIIHWFKK